MVGQSFRATRVLILDEVWRELVIKICSITSRMLIIRERLGRRVERLAEGVLVLVLELAIQPNLRLALGVGVVADKIRLVFVRKVLQILDNILRFLRNSTLSTQYIELVNYLFPLFALMLFELLKSLPGRSFHLEHLAVALFWRLLLNYEAVVWILNKPIQSHNRAELP